jgi:FHA domain
VTRCPFCRIPYVPNTIFCNECGQYLVKENSLETDLLTLPETAPDSDPAEALEPASAPRSKHEILTLRLKIGEQQFELPLDKPIHLGRIDATSSVFPELDLSRQGELAKSVSRRHARISIKGNEVMIEDLGSVNGTYLNTERLTAYELVPLSDGDILRLGQLPMEIQIRRQ